MSTGQFCSDNLFFGTKEKHESHGSAQTPTISCFCGYPKICTLANSAQTISPLEPARKSLGSLASLVIGASPPLWLLAVCLCFIWTWGEGSLRRREPGPKQWFQFKFSSPQG
jgi:hypothetical protein